MAQAFVLPDANTTLQANIETRIAGSLTALQTCFSGATAPTPTVAYMLWADTTTGTLKQRDGSNAAWWIISPLGADYTYQTNYLGATVSATVTYALRFAPASKFIVTAATVISTAATVGSVAGVTEWQFALLNQTTALNLFSATVGTGTACAGVGGGAEIAANTAYTLTANQNQTMAANDVLRLTLTRVGAPTNLTDCFVQIYGTNRGA